MSEPKAVATRAEPVVEGVWTWTVSDDRLGGKPSTAVAVEEGPGSVVVINPIRLEPGELDRLGNVSAILLTSRGHLRSSEHYRDESGAAIWAHVKVDLGAAKADETFTEGNELPGGLKVVELPGPSESECAFYLKRGKGVMILGDALMNLEGRGGFQVLPEEHNPDVKKTRASLKKLLEYDFDAMVFGHGEPIREGAKQRLKELLGT